jgi:alanine dehydrogenase
MLVLDRCALELLLDDESVVTAVEAVFAAHGRGETVMPPKVYLSLPACGGDFRAMPAYAAGLAGLKWVNVHPHNPVEHGLPTVMAVVLLNDPQTGQPLAILDGGTVTRLRTGAAAAVATRHLARPGARTLGQIGCGGMAPCLVRAVALVRPFDEIVVAARNPAHAAALVAQLAPLPARAGSLREAAGCDVVTTATPSTEPVVLADWVRPGTHVNAVGADAPGKEELDPALLRRGRVFVDDRAQAVHSGEINVPIAQGSFRADEVVATLGEVVAGAAPGRRAPDEITVFDSTGLAIQDLAVGRLAYDRARAAGAGTELRLF